MSPRIDERRPVRIRHIRPATPAEVGDPLGPNALPITFVLGRPFVAANPAGVNGRGGWVSGTVELRLIEEGRFSLRFPNAAGDDGIEHADRFAILADPTYEAGDEWLEVWEDVTPGLNPAGPLFVGTPTEATIGDAELELSGFDALELLKTVHETAAGFWAHAPRDVFEAYTHAWVPEVVETFDDPAAIAAGGPFVTLELRQDDPALAGATVANGELRLQGASNHSGNVIVESSDPVFSAGDAATRAKAGFRVESVISMDYQPNGVVTPITVAEWGLGNNSWVDLGTDVGSAVISTDSWLASGVVGRDINGIWSVRWYTGNGPGDHSGGIYQRIDSPIRVALAIEVRDRWVYCYANGELGAVLPRWPDSGEPVYLRAYNWVSAASAGPPYNLTAMSLEHWLVRSRRPFLLRGTDPGTYRLPGEPQPGGLVGSYFDERDLIAALQGSSAKRVRHSMKPGREPVARRLDAGIGPTTIATLPPGVPADTYAVRWTGSVFLNLADRDLVIRVAGLDDMARVWVGKTRGGEEYLSDWGGGGPSHTLGITGTSAPTTAGLRNHLLIQPDPNPLSGRAPENGWYPIVLEYLQGPGAASISLEYAERDPATGTLGAFVLIPPEKLSPQGIYEASIRGDSHYEQLQEQGRTFGLQWMLEPRSLESGRFPGELVPRIRVGGDTERVIGPDDLTDGKPTRTLAARDVVQGLILDAAGIATDGAQLSIEQLDFAELGRHLLIHEDLVSLSDITIAEVLKTRGRTLQTLRSSALEEVAFRPRGSTELVDTFPLTGALTRLAWTPGLGVRLAFPRLRIADVTPRQLIAVQRSITPAAIGPPEVSFRPRPRSPRAALRALSRSFGATQRQYQGQVAALLGNMAAAPASAAMPDTFSRVAWPTNSERVVGGELIVHAKSDASAWNIFVNGVDTGLDVTAPGRIDLSGFVRRDAGWQRCYVNLTGGTGTTEYQLELRARI